MKKRLLSLLLVLCMSVSLLSGISFAADSEEVWSFDSESELLSITVDGVTTTHEVETVTGAVEDYFNNTVTIGGVTYTGSQYFLDEIGRYSIAEFYCSSMGRGFLRGGAYFVYDGKQLWATKDSVMFLLYTTSSSSRNVRFKTCDLYNMADFSSYAIPVYTEGDNYKDLNGAAVLASGLEITFAVMTYGVGTPTMVMDGNDVGYIVDSVMKYNAATRKNYLEVSLVDMKTKKLVTGKFLDARSSDMNGWPVRFRKAGLSMRSARLQTLHTTLKPSPRWMSTSLVPSRIRKPCTIRQIWGMKSSASSKSPSQLPTSAASPSTLTEKPRCLIGRAAESTPPLSPPSRLIPPVSNPLQF